jgi:hypothetical protein
MSIISDVLQKKTQWGNQGQGSADGRRQRETTTKEQASSPIVAIESVMILCTIDAHKKQFISTVDVPGAFKQVNMDETVHMRIEGPMAELLIRLDPELY